MRREKAYARFRSCRGSHRLTRPPTPKGRRFGWLQEVLPRIPPAVAFGPQDPARARTPFGGALRLLRSVCSSCGYRVPRESVRAAADLQDLELTAKHETVDRRSTLRSRLWDTPTRCPCRADAAVLMRKRVRAVSWPRARALEKTVVPEGDAARQCGRHTEGARATDGRRRTQTLDATVQKRACRARRRRSDFPRSAPLDVRRLSRREPGPARRAPEVPFAAGSVRR